MQSSPIPSVGAPAIARMFARIAGRTPIHPPGSVAAWLGEWIDWPRAVELSRALDAPAGAAEGGPFPDPRPWEQKAAEARAALAAEIAAGPGPATAAAAAGPLQQHVHAMQRAIQSVAGRLRGELQELLLASGSPAQVRLARVDAVMEAVLAPREHALLAAVPDLVAARPGPPQPDAPASAGEPERPAASGHEIRDLLLAELDLRFLPVEGLLAALRGP